MWVPTFLEVFRPVKPMRRASSGSLVSTLQAEWRRGTSGARRLAVASLFASVALPSMAGAAEDRRSSTFFEGAEPGAGDATAPLRVSVAPSIDDAGLLTEWLTGRGADVSTALERTGHEQWIAVRIDGHTYDYHVTVTAMRDGEPISPSAAPLACECNANALLALIDGEIATAVYRLRSMPVKGGQAARTDVAPAPEPKPKRDPCPAASESERPRLWTISRLGVAGVAMGTIGLAGLGAGASLVVAEEHEIPGWSKYYRELDPLGLTMLSAGAAALAGGIAMLLVDGIRLRRQRGSHPRTPRSHRMGSVGVSRGIGLVPGFEGRAGGAMVWGRF